MLFSSLVFLVLFLPFVLLGYYALPFKFKNGFLFLSSIVFYAWGGVSYSAILIISILLNYGFGLLINQRKNKKLFLALGIGINLLFLLVFKYANFIIENINQLMVIINIPKLDNKNIALPIGISFYTFQAISYLIDVYRKTCNVQRNLLNLGLYVSFFPQLIAGPIVRYYDIQQQIMLRAHESQKFISGVKRFTLGFAKKVLIANSMAYVADQVFQLSPQMLSNSSAWIGIIAYSLQIYYDFSGYSDMAIGLARMFGFDLLENFNFPYMARSIKEFWRRWHISLSNWFRDYLYIPLGGNRLGGFRTVLNLGVVFFVTGFWHGASWNFLIWGLLHGMFLVLERTKWGVFLDKIPKIIQNAYTLAVAVLAWVLFRAETLSEAIGFYKALFIPNGIVNDPYFMARLVNRETIIVFIIAIAGAFGVFFKAEELLKLTVFNQSIKTALVCVFVVVVFTLGIGNLVLGSYNPFIYFKF